VVNATAKIGARVESEPSINPVMAGCTRCNRNDCLATVVGPAIIPISGLTSEGRFRCAAVTQERRFDDTKSVA
jgi:hypothetical protein